MPIALEQMQAYGVHHRAWERCRKCAIGCLARFHTFYRGAIPADVLFIGEAPGKTENAVGRPFIGKAGAILNGWILNCMPTGTRYCVTNLVLCRPTDRLGGPNRQPNPEEIENCRPRLEEFVELVQPRVVVLLGRVAAEASTLSRNQRPTLELMHPAAILRGAGKNGPTDLRQQMLLEEFLTKELR